MINKKNTHTILIIDFGSQYTYLIARRIRDMHINFIISKWNISKIELINLAPRGIILSGSPCSVIDHNSPQISMEILNYGVPVLGICYGMHTMVHQLGGIIKKNLVREFGYETLYISNTQNDLIYNKNNTESSQKIHKPVVWMSHEDSIYKIPKNFKNIANTKKCKYAAIFNKKYALYGVQFHPEVTHSYEGTVILERFVKNICHCISNKKYHLSIDKIILKIKNTVKNDKVILGISGGIDSVTTAMIMHRAIGSNLFCIFIDNGLLRWNELKEVQKILKKIKNINFIILNKKKLFLHALSGIHNPEEKRKKIGKIFFEIFGEQSKVINAKWLAQGTIYPDIIESSRDLGMQCTIKSHHNACKMPKKIGLTLIEPLKKLFKDEVRTIAKKLGISKNIIFRHPFPGPGLAIRIIGEIKEEYCNLLRLADKIFITELKKENLYFNINQAFAIFLPIQSVGIMGDSRKYEWVIALRAIHTVDFMTARWVKIPYKILDRISSLIINNIDGISRVVYDISNKPPATIEWE
ncbi:GMP synthetase (glutamine aminotransferase) [Wigglesworthia glossinidia endosymbiont of Glossina morsitans morsitans (Yale colony)]|uniref:GMP synthase [glutamine-hydrolyzing] n=1 Tax=Wigglesworthia glossinidia endosymbiont of Glossina morsitans morsitans (Yale colony) TaxID=1142511 RepID=H6Q5J2_WIGGL|nr:glutamine-hydrolyzing GMP synthase [Wigglesworthia glossinidia]AFA41475.1 GMP synthetase (glutamine aminotransferase) [Wigglesworthia glossinidia endosymbiont of Glossina morsitans morsitans (Yale colony)]